ncbi:MAG TPA: DNA topoisomerase IV subunit A [Candidatus Krumholzibacteria bacterium]|nr:DNA topoisomerase IV subunit A [Candidatus Krumholzibacteria bacterium]
MAKKKSTAKKKTTAKKSPPRRNRSTEPAPEVVAKKMRAGGEAVVRRIQGEATAVQGRILERIAPSLKFPIRSLNNVVYKPAKGYFEIKGRKKERTLTVGTVKTFAQTLRMMAFSKDLVESDDIATKREAYYVSKNWDDARFNDQPESDTVMEDVEALFGVNREQLGFIPEEKGGDVAGQLVVIDQDRETGEELRIDCTRFGSGAYSIPISVEELAFETNAEFILAIETAGMFQRLVKHTYWRDANCILISLGGVPTRACRRFIRRLSDAKKLPVYVFVDGDPYGYSNIYRTLKVGSGNAAHMNEFFCVPNARFLGVTPQDITDFDLPTHPLKDVDIKRAKDAIKNDPFVQHHKPWQRALQQQIKMGVRVEQQALAKHGLNYVIDEYLPRKMANTRAFLP